MFAPGMPASLAEVVYRTGTQRDASDAMRFGIRLSLVLRLAEFHGGTMWLEARPGRYTTFHVELPNAVE
jgi:signal transduction histidine kinase